MNRSILPDIPDLYTDRMRVTVTVFGVNITFGLGAPHPDQQNAQELVDVLDLVRLRMSLEHAKIMTMILKQQLKTYEANTNTSVVIPKDVLEALNLSNENW